MELNRIGSLKKLLQQKQCVRILEAHNGLSALIVERSGFDGMWESSLTDSASKGLPDIELVSMDSRLETIRQIVDVTTKPLIVDGDTGGQVDHFPYWVNKMEKSGVSAVIIEDKVFPKRNSLDENGTHHLEDVDIFSEKIRRGCAARLDENFMIFARLESLIAKHSIYEAMIRAEAFLQAGADGILIHSKAKVDSDEIFEFAKRFREISDKPLICVPTSYNHVYDTDLASRGFNVIIHANHLLRASLLAMQKATDAIERAGRSVELDNEISQVKDIFKITGYDKIGKTSWQ